MDVSRYEFACQKALHQGLGYARSLGHLLLEVEHVALACLRADVAPLRGGDAERLKHVLETYLARSPRVYGQIKVEFGRRLDGALDLAEQAAAQRGVLVDEALLWEALVRQSTAVQTTLARLAQERDAAARRSQDFEAFDARQASGDPSPGSGSGSGGGTSSSQPRPRGDAKAPGGRGEATFGATGKPAAGRPGSDQSATGKPNAGKPATGKPASGEPLPERLPEKLEKDLHQFTVDLSAAAERGDLDPVIGRDAEVRRVLEILGRKKKSNPILIGEPGVGKSAIAEALALRIAAGTVPETMRGKRVLSLDLGAMLAGAKYRGEFEERMKNLLRALQALRGQVILFIDEIHMLVGAGNHEGGADAANLLKPSLARGELQCLGATTLDEFRKHIEKDPALERRFQPLLVEEPTKAASLAILRGLKSRYEIHHGVRIDDEALVSAVELSVRYLPQRSLPDKAIDLIDEAASRLRLQIDSVPVLLDELLSEIQTCEIERKALGAAAGAQAATGLARLDAKLEKARAEHDRVEAIWRRHQELLARLQGSEKGRQEAKDLYDHAKTTGDFDFAARLQFGELPRLEKESSDVTAELAALQRRWPFLRQEVGAREVAEIVAVWTRIPVGRLLEGDARKLRELEERLGRRVFGQTEALRRVAKAVRRARVGVGDPRRPQGVFLFLGPTGVGKTETAKALAAELFADEASLVRIDMSEFMEQHNTARLIGAPPGYVGYGDGGELTEAVRLHPYSVVLLDEVEKAHPRVLDLLLQTFDDGRLTDGQGRTVDFRNTLIIMTSNLALERTPDPDTAADGDVRADLATRLRPELVNRIDEVVVFRRLARKHLEHLLDRLLGELNGRLGDRPLRVSAGPRLRDRLLTAGASGPFGGRPLRRLFESQVVDSLSDRLLACPELAHGAWTLELDADDRLKWLPEHRAGYYLPAAAAKRSGK